MELDKIRSQYVIKHPCKMQLDKSRSDLNDLQSRLISSMENILKSNRVNLDKVNNDFNFLSKNLVESKRHSLDLIHSGFSENLCLNKIAESRNRLDFMRNNLIVNVNHRVGSVRVNFDMTVSDFTNASQKIILRNSHRLDGVKNSSTIKNPKKIYASKYEDLNQIRKNKILKNPYMVLEPYKNDLNMQKEKLDKINSVIVLKKEQKQQRRTYMIIIAAVMIIALIIILGGIL